MNNRKEFCSKIPDDGGRECAVIDDLPGGTAGDARPVEGEHIAAVLIHVEMFGKRCDSVDGTSAGKDNDTSGFLDLDQSLPCGLGDLLFGICQRTVQIEYEYLVFHKNPPELELRAPGIPVHAGLFRPVAFLWLVLYMV